MLILSDAAKIAPYRSKVSELRRFLAAGGESFQF